MSVAAPAPSSTQSMTFARGDPAAALAAPAREEVVFSSRHACPVCGYSVPTLEPKLFSFNSPSGDPVSIFKSGVCEAMAGTTRSRNF